jgi:transcriptional regulator with XRE-family HTH domain
MQLSDRLKYERMQRGWSQARVAELIGTDAGNVSRWERGRSSPSPYFRERLCQLYEKNAQELGLLKEELADMGEPREGAFRDDRSAQAPLLEAVLHKKMRMKDRQNLFLLSLPGCSPASVMFSAG